MSVQSNHEEEMNAALAKTITLMCVRNSYLEDLHAGKTPVSKTGDYSDVKVVDATGKEISWLEVSRISDEEMKKLMKSVVNGIFTWLMRSGELSYQAHIDRWGKIADKWDAPVLVKFQPPEE